MLRILVVEDNAADARLLVKAIEETGVPVAITLLEDGVSAIEYLAGSPGRPCDVLLLDLDLPRLSGFEVLLTIRSREDLRSLPVVILSGSTNVDQIHRCYEAGANSYISKPGRLEELFSTAERFVAYWSDCVQVPSGCPNRVFRAAENPK